MSKRTGGGGGGGGGDFEVSTPHASRWQRDYTRDADTSFFDQRNLHQQGEGSGAAYVRVCGGEGVHDNAIRSCKAMLKELGSG